MSQVWGAHRRSRASFDTSSLEALLNVVSMPKLASNRNLLALPIVGVSPAGMVGPPLDGPVVHNTRAYRGCRARNILMPGVLVLSL